jgi:hypothetical protein
MKTFSKYIISKLLECRNYTNKYINEPIESDISRYCDIIAIGDIHGDIQLMLDTLTIGGVIRKINEKNINSIQIIRKDKNDNYYIEYYEWIGKNTIVVQVGDQIDRCRLDGKNVCDNKYTTYDDEASDIEILLFFTNLHEKAKIKGGAVYSLLGNHELMNIWNDIRYVSYKNLEQLEVFDEEINTDEEINNELKQIITSEDNNIIDYMERRINIFRRGGILAKFLASTRYSILIVNGYLFVHGGVLGSYIGSYIKEYNNIHREHFQRLNEKIKNYIIKNEEQEEQEEREIYNFIFNTNSPFYTRKLGQIKNNENINRNNCKDVKNIIKYYSLKGIIVGHTPQENGINGTCLKEEEEKNTLFRIDVASSKAFHFWPKINLQAQVLKISNNKMQILKFKNGKNGIDGIIYEDIY